MVVWVWALQVKDVRLRTVCNAFFGLWLGWLESDFWTLHLMLRSLWVVTVC